MHNQCGGKQTHSRPSYYYQGPHGRTPSSQPPPAAGLSGVPPRASLAAALQEQEDGANAWKGTPGAEQIGTRAAKTRTSREHHRHGKGEVSRHERPKLNPAAGALVDRTRVATRSRHRTRPAGIPRRPVSSAAIGSRKGSLPQKILAAQQRKIVSASAARHPPPPQSTRQARNAEYCTGDT